MKNDSTKERIIDVTLKIVARDGTDGITMRRIAAESGVNVAAINYHFGRKSELIRLVVEKFKKKLGVFRILNDPSLDVVERVYRFTEIYTETMMRHPGLLRSFFSQIVSGKIEYPGVIELIHEIISMLKNTFSEIIYSTSDKTDSESDETISIMIIQMMSSVVYPILVADQSEKIFHFSYDNSSYRQKYLQILLNRTFPQYRSHEND